MSTPVNPLGIPSTIDTFILNTTLAHFTKQLTDNAYDKPTIWKILEAECKKHVDGGVSIVEQLVEKEQDDGGFYLGADVLNNTQKNTLGMVEFQWQNMYEPITISRDEERMNNGDKEKILNLLATKTYLSSMAMYNRGEQAISQALVEANNLKSLDELVGTGTFGSINGSTDTFWQSTVTSSGAFNTQGLADMSTAYNATAAGVDVDTTTHIFTTRTIYQKYEDTGLSLDRVSNSSLSYNVGKKALTFKGEPVLWGKYIKSGEMLGLNMRYIKLYVDSKTDFITLPFIGSNKQTVRVSYMLWRGAFGTNNRRRNWKLTDVT